MLDFVKPKGETREAATERMARCYEFFKLEYKRDFTDDKGNKIKTIIKIIPIINFKTYLCSC